MKYQSKSKSEKKVIILILIFLVTEVMLTGEAKTLDFSGFTWVIKESGEKKVAPGPNYYSSEEDSVFLDDENRLHMLIRAQENRWICSEIFTREKFSYGTYKVELLSSLNVLHPQMVLGLFTYDLANRLNHQEIDIEFSRWGNSNLLPGYFTVQPYDITGNSKSFDLDTETVETTHIFIWEKEKITFASYYGHGELNEENLIQLWVYEGEYIPVPQKPSFRINLWLFQGKAPENSAEIIIKSFTYKQM